MNIGKFILHYNTPELTDKLCHQVTDAIVIDNGSDADKRYCGNNRVICIEKNQGFTAGWNTCIRYFKEHFDFLWLMNSDIEINQESLKHIEETLTDDIDMLTPSYNSVYQPLTNYKTNNIRQVGMIELTAPIINRKVFDKIGLLDEIFVRGYGVEFDFCYRMRNHGLKMWVDDRCFFNHLGQQTINKHEGLSEYAKKANEELRTGLEKIYGSNWRKIVFENSGIECRY